MTVEARQTLCVVYGLVDPRDHKIRYIGHTRSPRQRLSCHRHSGPAARWLHEIEAKTGERWPFVVLHADLPRKEAREAERAEIWRNLWRGAHLLNGDYPDRRMWDHRIHFPGDTPWASVHEWRRDVQTVPCPQCRALPQTPCGVWRTSSAWGRLSRDRRRMVLEIEPHANHNRRITAYLRHRFPACTGTIRASAPHGDVHAEQLEIPLP